MKPSVSIIKFFTFVLTTIFSFYAILSIVNVVIENNEYNLYFDNLLSAVNEFNANNNDNDTYNEGNIDDELDQHQILFTNASQALSSAYTQLNDADSYYSDATINFNAESSLKTLNINIHIKQVQYEDGDFLQEIILDETTNIFTPSNFAFLIFYKKSSNKIYRKNAVEVTKLSNSFNVEYPSVWNSIPLSLYISSGNTYPWIPPYIINDRTVIEQTFFNNAAINNARYQAQAALNSTLASTNFLKYLKHLFSTFKNDLLDSIQHRGLTVSTILNDKGEPLKIIYDSTFKLNFNHALLTSSNCTMELDYSFNSFNKLVNYEKPYISPFD